MEEIDEGVKLYIIIALAMFVAFLMFFPGRRLYNEYNRLGTIRPTETLLYQEESVWVKTSISGWGHWLSGDAITGWGKATVKITDQRILESSPTYPAVTAGIGNFAIKEEQPKSWLAVGASLFLNIAKGDLAVCRNNRGHEYLEITHRSRRGIIKKKYAFRNMESVKALFGMETEKPPRS